MPPLSISCASYTAQSSSIFIYLNSQLFSDDASAKAECQLPQACYSSHTLRFIYLSYRSYSPFPKYRTV